jgi:hypothetical protein
MFTNINVYQALPAFLNQPNMVLKISVSIDDWYSSNGKNTLLWTEEHSLSYDGFWQNDTRDMQKVKESHSGPTQLSQGVHTQNMRYEDFKP